MSNNEEETKSKLVRNGTLSSINSRVISPSSLQKPINLNENTAVKHGSKARESLRRRITTIDPGVNIADINYAASAKKALNSVSSNRGLSKPSRIYSFHCEGDIEGKDKQPSKHVIWNATFEKPIEELIYPSLQRFDNEAFLKKKEAYYQLHGRHEYSTKRSAPLSGRVGSKGDIENFTTETSNLFHLDQLQETELNKDSLFCVLPHWTVSVSEIIDETKREEGLALTLLEDIELNGEKFLREKIRKQNLEQQHAEESVNGLLSSENAIKSNDGRSRRRDKSRYGGELKAMDTPDQLYSLLTRNSTRNGSRNTVEPVKLNKLTVEEVSLNKHRKQLESLVPKELDHLLNGVLYYRLRNDLYNHEQEVKVSTMKSKMEVSPTRVLNRRASNMFISRVSSKGKGKEFGNVNVSELHAMHQDNNLLLVSSAQLDRINSAAHDSASDIETTLLRLRRATDAKRVSYKNNHNLTLLNEPSTTETEEENKRTAKDALLLAQLDRGVLPENFLKRAIDSELISIDLSNYGIGDERGLCLSSCLTSLTMLESLGLSENRLSSKSLPTILQNLCFNSLLHLDLSFNMMHQHGSLALANWFKGKTQLKFLDISNCQIQCSDIRTICRVLNGYNNKLEEFYLSSNKVSSEGALDLCAYIGGQNCFLRILDLSWNNISELGSIALANAITVNTSLVHVNVASNGLNDFGGQKLAECIGLNMQLQEVNLSQNSLSDRTCFVLSRSLKGHLNMHKLDLSLNPLGEAGARSLFRTILRGLKCFVIMRGCSYKVDNSIFNSSYPSLDSPYHLDMTEPYSCAILSELLTKISLDPLNCFIESISYKETPKSADVPIPLIVQDGKVVNRFNGDVWIPPTSGTINLHFTQSVFVPTLDQAIDERAFNVLQVIVENGRTETDRRNWLRLLCQDISCTTTQAQSMVDRFQKNKTIGPGGLQTLDIIKSLWEHLLDTENMFDLLCKNADIQLRRDLVYALTIKRYKFNWANPTGSWRLNLAEKDERAIMLQLIAINAVESEFGRNSGHRGDTSQMGNWFNFRNGKMTIDRVQTDLLMDKEFVKSLPMRGTVEFDYVSTTLAPDYLRCGETKPNESARAGQCGIITDDEFYSFLHQLNLSSRRKVSSANVLFALLDLQLASTKYYFTINRLRILLDAFSDDWDVQSKVIICMFSRIVDLHNIDIVLRNLDSRTQQDVVRRIGYLNLMNPLKISFDYMLHLKYLDNRILLVALMELANTESPDQIIEDVNTELPIAAMYGAFTRALNEVRPETMKFTFSEFGERTNNVSWHARKDLLKKFLVGTRPINEQIYSIITMHKELEAAGALTRGPLDLQYANYKKSLRLSGVRGSSKTPRIREG